MGLGLGGCGGAGGVKGREQGIVIRAIKSQSYKMPELKSTKPRSNQYPTLNYPSEPRSRAGDPDTATNAVKVGHPLISESAWLLWTLRGWRCGILLGWWWRLHGWKCGILLDWWRGRLLSRRHRVLLGRRNGTRLSWRDAGFGGRGEDKALADQGVAYLRELGL